MNIVFPTQWYSLNTSVLLTQEILRKFMEMLIMKKTAHISKHSCANINML